MSKLIYQLRGARQASFGIETPSPTGFLTLKESFGEYDLSVEVAYGTGDVVGEIADDASPEQQWNALAGLEGIQTTWAEQEAVREADRIADEQQD